MKKELYETPIACPIIKTKRNIFSSFYNNLCIASTTLLLLLTSFSIHAQTFYVNTGNGSIYLINPKTCTSTLICSGMATYNDMAMCGTTLYVTINNNILSLDLTTCTTKMVNNQFNTQFGGIKGLSSLVCDGNGVLYAADGVSPGLYSYNIATNTWTFVGNPGTASAGDLTFYNGFLYLAGTGNKLVKITLSPFSGTVVGTMNAATDVFGIITISSPGPCGTGGATQMLATAGNTVYTVDPATGNCTLPCVVLPNGIVIYGAASPSENGTTPPLPLTVLATPDKICPGEGSTLTATGSNTYSWNTGSSGSSITVSPTTTTTYTVTGTDANACTSTGTVAVTVNPLPTATITGTTSICNGGNTTLTAAGGNNYTWSNGATTTAITVSPTITTTYTVTAKKGGCSGTASVVVTVNPIPTITTSPTTICAGGTATLTATGGTTYLWSTGETTTAITVSPAVSTTYTVTATSAGCSSSAKATVTVGSSIIPVIAGNTTICNGGSTTLSTSGGGTYTWSDASTGSSITVSPTITTSYSVTVTNGSCSGTATVQVTVANSPTPTITGNTNVCPGTGTTLTANGGSIYVWDNGATTPSITVSPSSQTTYTVTASTNGCTGVTTVVVNITTPPVPSITGNTVICNGGSTTLTGNGGGTYAWNTGATTTSISVSPTVTTTYTLIVTTGCSASTTVEVTVQPTLTPTITGVNPICNGTSTTLSASGGGTYAWNDGTTGPSITVSPVTPTSYSVTVTNGLCSGTASVLVTVNPNPTPTISGNTVICNGQNTTLTANAGGAYAWNTGAVTASITVSPTNNTTYTVTVTTGGCTGTATVGVTVNQTPAPVITGINTVCTGQGTTLTSSTTGPYSWSTGATTGNISVTPSSTTTYTISVTASGCTGTASRIVTVIPPVVASVSGNNICIGENVTLTASGGTTYSWDNGAGTSAITVSPAATTTYTVIVASGNCADTATYTVTVNLLPIAIASGDTTITFGQSAQLNSSGGGTYQWIPPTDLSCSNCASPIATPSQTTQYCVIVRSTEGCTDSACVTVIVELKCGFEGELFVPNGFSPNGDGQNDVLYVRGLGITQMYWAIYDRWGERVFETTDFTQGWDGMYKGKPLDPAVFVYYLNVTCITGEEIKQKGNVAIIK